MPDLTPYDSPFMPSRENMAPDDDAFKSPLQQIPEGYQKTFAPLIERGLAAGQDLGSGFSSGLGRAFLAMEAMGASQQGRQPLWLQLQDRQDAMALEQQKAQDALALRREQQAQHIAQLEEAKKQHKQKTFLDIMTKQGISDTQRAELLKPFAEEDEQFRIAIDGIGKKRFGKLNTYANLYPDEINGMVKEWQDGQLTSEDIDQRFSMLEDRTKRRAAAKAEAMEYKRLSGLAEQSLQTGVPMDSSDQAEFVRMQTEMAKRQEELQAIRLKNELTQKKVDSGGSEPKVNDLIGSERTRDILTAQGHEPLSVAQRAINKDPEAIKLLQSARAQSDREQGELEAKKALGRGLGTGDVPVGVESNLYTKLLPDGTSQAISDPNMGKIEAGKRGYRDTVRFKDNLERADKSRTALRSLGDLERYATAIIQAQGPVDIGLQGMKLTLQGITKGGALTKLKAPNGKFMTVGEVAKAYEDESLRLADQLAKGAGIVGTLTEQDTKKNLAGLPGRYESANLASEKFGLFNRSFGNNILQEYERAYGRDGVPESLRTHLKKGKLPQDLKTPAREFLKKQEQAYREMGGYTDAEIRDLLIRDFQDAGYQ